MPDQDTLERAREDAAEGKSPSTQAGEFVREEIEHVREASMALGRPSRRSRSDCPRLGAPEPNCGRREVRRCPSKRAEKPDRIPRPPQSHINLRESGRER